MLLCVLNMTHRQHAVGTAARFDRARVVKNMGTPTTSTRAATSKSEGKENPKKHRKWIFDFEYTGDEITDSDLKNQYKQA